MLYIIVLLIIIIIIILNKYNNKNENFEILANVKNVERPYVNLYSNDGRLLNIILISKPFGYDNNKGNNLYEELINNNNIILGITSYLEFPNPISNTYDHLEEDYRISKYKEKCEAWLHCFKNPEDYFDDHVPRLLISESDFTNCKINKPINIQKEYDFIYICLKQDEKKDLCDDWATFNKNWTLAKKCLTVMCREFKLKGVLVGRKDCDIGDLGACDGLMYKTNMVSNNELRTLFNKSRFIFLPNVADASPRVLSEALLHNLPCLANTNLLGGWKYINNNTGMYFNNEQDISSVLRDFLPKINTFTPRKFFISNYGPEKSGKKLKEFLYTHFKDRINIPENEVDYITIDNPVVNYKECLY